VADRGRLAKVAAAGRANGDVGNTGTLRCGPIARLPAPGVTLDGRPVAVSEVETALLRITLPAENLFRLPVGTQGLPVAHGWVALLRPLPPGTHTIVITLPTQMITTTIVVRSGH